MVCMGDILTYINDGGIIQALMSVDA
jgi:hypothetical protein